MTIIRKNWTFVSFSQAEGTSVVGTHWKQFQQAFALVASPQQQFPLSPTRDIHLPQHQRRPKLKSELTHFTQLFKEHRPKTKDRSKKETT